MKNDQIKIDSYLEYFTNKLISYVPNIVGAILIFIVGVIIIKLLRRLITGIVTKRPDHDPTVLKFLLDVLTWILRILLFIQIIEQLGVQTTTFAAAIAAAGLAIGLSLQGSLSNFAGGLLIILFKPFRIGDYIEAQGQGGTVSSIQIFSTRLITSNNQVVYLPNGTLSNNTIKNFSQESKRRAEILLNVSYHNNLKLVKDIIFTVINADDNILKTPAPGFEVRALNENSVQVVVYLWSERTKYGAMVSNFYINIKAAFEQAGIELPTPQQALNINYVPTDKNGDNN